ncbi:MAG: hypothetical protein ABIF77_18400 [bacterium]
MTKRSMLLVAILGLVLLDGLAAMVCVGGIDRGAQGLGVVIAVVVVLVTGLVAGRILALTGHRNRPYEDSEKFDSPL